MKPIWKHNWEHYDNEQRLAYVKAHRATMRAHAMQFRSMICPSGAQFHGWTYRTETAAKYIQHAITYRNLSQRNPFHH